MKIRLSQLRRIIREEVEILNADTGEVLVLPAVADRFRSRLVKTDGHDALSNDDFEELRKQTTLQPDAALKKLEAEAAALRSEVDGDLGTAMDLAAGFKTSYPKEWRAALRAERIRSYFYGEDFADMDEALARYLAETMG